MDRRRFLAFAAAGRPVAVLASPSKDQIMGYDLAQYFAGFANSTAVAEDLEMRREYMLAAFARVCHDSPLTPNAVRETLIVEDRGGQDLAPVSAASIPEWFAVEFWHLLQASAPHLFAPRFQYQVMTPAVVEASRPAAMGAVTLYRKQFRGMRRKQFWALSANYRDPDPYMDPQNVCTDKAYKIAGYFARVNGADFGHPSCGIVEFTGLKSGQPFGHNCNIVIIDGEWRVVDNDLADYAPSAAFGPYTQVTFNNGIF